MLAEDARIERIGARLLNAPAGTATELVPDWAPPVPHERPATEAAVLIGLVRRPEGLTVLYTERSPELRSHSGQIAFPGGKIDPEDAGPAAAAIREAGEEVDLDPRDARIIGYLPSYLTGSNYLIVPVVAVVDPGRPFVPNPGEVSSVFEVPLGRLAAEGSYGTYRLQRHGVEHTTWQIDHQGRLIWGITANLTRRFYELALKGEPDW